MSEDFNLATANGPQMKTWAKNNLDMSLTLNMNEDTMRERIQARCSELGIEAPMAVIQTRHDMAKKVKRTALISIPMSEKPGGTEPVFVGVQGTGYLIPRGIEVEVSPAIVEVLRNAITDNVVQDEEGELIHNEVPTYPFSILRAAPEAVA